MQPRIRRARFSILNLISHYSGQQTFQPNPQNPKPQAPASYRFTKVRQETYLEQIPRPEHRAPGKIPRVHRHNQHLLAGLQRPLLSHPLRVRQVVIHTNERAADVGLLVQVREPEARERGGVVEDCGLVFRAEAGAEGVSGLRVRAVDAVY